MTHFVIDVNVLIVANQSSPQADDECQLAVIEKLEKIREKHTVVIDTSDEVFKRYRKHLSASGKPYLGDFFFRYIYENQAVAKRVQQVEIKKTAVGEFEKFPKNLDFDKDDRLWIALHKSKKNSKILNAVDSDYRISIDSLKKYKIQVEELCSHCLKQP